MSYLVSALTWSGIALVVLGFGWAMAKRAGRVEEQRDQAEASTERARERHEIDEDVARLSDSALDDELRTPR